MGFQDEVILGNLFHFIFFQVVSWSSKFLVRKTLGRSRIDPHPPHGGNLRCPEWGSNIYFRRSNGGRGNEVQRVKMIMFSKKVVS